MKTSNARKCTKPLAQRYKTKQDLRQNSTKSIKLFDFLISLCDFWIFDTRNKKIDKTKLKIFTSRQANTQHQKQQANQTNIVTKHRKY